ncbi:MAG: T9SS type A sorting domain-containing protein [Bacteroidota bacterium]
MKKPLLFLFMCVMGISLCAQPLINEFQPNAPGADPDPASIELKGVPGASFSGFISSIEADGSTAVVDRLSAVSGTFDDCGLAVVEVPDLENPSFTIVFSSDDPTVGAGTGTDLDTDDDGMIDNISVFGTVFDAIGIPDASNDEQFLVGAQLGGTDFMYTGDEPQRVFRTEDTEELVAVNDPVGNEVYRADGTTVPVSDLAFDPTTTNFGFKDGILPIELTYFNAKLTNDNQVELNWRTETEIDNDYIQIERARDGKSFEPIGKVQGAGTTLEAQVYTFIDEQPLKGANYYRLKQVDFNGTFEYHKVVVVSVNDDKVTNLFPTFVQDQLTVAADGFAQVSVFNEAGQLVKAFSINGTESLAVSDLAAGTYHVVIEQNGTRETKRFVKQ